MKKEHDTQPGRRRVSASRPSHQRGAGRPHGGHFSRPSRETTPSVPAVFDKNALRVIPIGGLEEVGRNMAAIEYGDNILIIDMGLQFPEEDMPGVDYIIPNIEYFKGKERNVLGVIITHAHYDHIGAIPHLIPRLANPPLYGTDLTLAIIKRRQEDFKEISSRLELHQITNDTKLELGIFKVEFFGVSHNIPGSVGVIVHTPEGILVHTGDFKIDERSNIAGVTELDKLERIGKHNPLLLMSDSTNAREIGKQHSEIDIMTELEDIVKNAKGRLIFGTFASLLGRLNEIIQLAAKYKKKLIIEGRSMKNNVEIAKELGYITVPKGTVIPVEEMKSYRNHEIMILATGAQGEERAVLMRIANREHRFIEVEPGDTFVFSSSVIPGNERTVQRLTDKLYREGVDVINYRMMDIHAGGHAKQEDLKKMIEIVKPRYFMPIEGNHSFLRIHGKIATRAGYADDKILVADNGQVIQCKGGICVRTKEKVPSDYVFVDGLGVGDVGDVVLRDRQMMAKDGMFVVIATFDNRTKRVMGNPDLISRGFIYMRESKELLMEVRRLVKRIVEQSAGNHAPGEINWTYIKDNIREEVGEFLYHKTHRHPMVLPVVIEV
ncbi:ribonuclease J [Candidatus Azambacteria bacterium]|nr:ribonuclease J [Candidatus Azambacteria bacterium]